MANWATLKPFILQQIVSIYGASIILADSDSIDIDIYFSYLQLNQVCQHWRVLIKKSLHTSAILLCTIPTAEQQLRYGNNADFNELALSGIHLSTSSPYPILWRTNIPHIVSSKSSSATTELVVSSQGCNIDFPSLGTVLELFGFSSAKWYSLTGIRFLDGSPTAGQNTETEAPTSDDTHIKLSNSSQYLAKNIPNVKRLWHWQKYILLDNRTLPPLSELLDFYLPRLQTLSLPALIFPALTHKHFPQYLTRLGLTISSESAEYLPKIFAPSLVNLGLTYTDTVHYWDIFRDSFPGPVVFKNLEHLVIYHLLASISAENSDAYLSRVSFPKLKQLSLYRYPFRDFSALTIFKNSPLQNVTIQDQADNFDPSVVSVFRDVPSLRIGVSMRKEKVTDQLVRSIAKGLFSKPFSTRNVDLTIPTSLPIPLPDAILWTQLEKLYMQFPVYLLDLTTILPKLPRLHWLLVGAIYYTECNSADYSMIPTWSSSIAQLTLFSSIVHIPTVPSLDAMCTLVSGLPSLLTLVVPEDMVSTANQVLSEHIGCRRSGKARLEVVSYIPSNSGWYLKSGLSYNTRRTN